MARSPFLTFNHFTTLVQPVIFELTIDGRIYNQGVLLDIAASRSKLRTLRLNALGRKWLKNH